MNLFNKKGELRLSLNLSHSTITEAKKNVKEKGHRMIKRENERLIVTYIESRKQSNNHTCKIYGCCIYTNRIKHH